MACLTVIPPLCNEYPYCHTRSTHYEGVLFKSDTLGFTFDMWHCTHHHIQPQDHKEGYLWFDGWPFSWPSRA